MSHPLAKSYVGLCTLLPGVDDEPPRDSDLWRSVIDEARAYFNAEQLRTLARNLRQLAHDLESDVSDGHGSRRGVR